MLWWVGRGRPREGTAQGGSTHHSGAICQPAPAVRVTWGRASHGCEPREAPVTDVSQGTRQSRM